MTKRSSYLRNLAWTARRRLLRDNWDRLLLALVFLLIINVIVTLSIWLAFPPAAPFVLEALILIEIAGFWFWMLIHDGELHRRLGIMGESWSASELAALKKHGWVMFDNVLFQNFDVDHVLIGPAGAFAIETKLTVMPNAEDYVDAAIRRSQAGARKVTLLLRTHRINVEPVLFLWGPGYRDVTVDESTRTTVIKGNDVSHWVREVSRMPRSLDDATLKAATAVVADYKRKRDAHEAVRRLGSSESLTAPDQG